MDDPKRKLCSWPTVYVASRVPSDHSAVITRKQPTIFSPNWRTLRKALREKPIFDRVRVNVVLP